LWAERSKHLVFKVVYQRSSYLFFVDLLTKLCRKSIHNVFIESLLPKLILKFIHDVDLQVISFDLGLQVLFKVEHTVWLNIGNCFELLEFLFVKFKALPY
jgi:hypothetical protein